MNKDILGRTGLHLNTPKLAVTFLLSSILVLQMTSGKALQHPPFKSTLATQQDDSTIQNVTFKLLAVEHCLGKVPVEGAQHLIKSLISFSNWQNNTVSAGFRYLSYIHFLSEFDLAQIPQDLQPYYRGRANKTNLITEISTFLNLKLPSENDGHSVSILYFVGNTQRIVTGGNTSYCLALDQLVYDWELDQALPRKGVYNSSCTLVILDSCYSGGYIAKLAGPGRIILSGCSPVETVGESLGPEDQSSDIWFTGNESAAYSNGTSFGPLGLIGGIETAEDSNRDGWRSASEIFKLASQTVRWYAGNHTDQDTGNPFSIHPWGHFGVAGGGIPFVQLDQSKPFPENPPVFPLHLYTPDPFHYAASELRYPMYQYSPSHKGFTTAEGPETSHLLWKVFLSHPITGSASVADGMVFLGTTGGTFYALEMTTGQLVWKFSAGSPICSSPAVKENIVVFGTQEPGRIYALDEYTGTVRWTYGVSEGNAAFSSPTIEEGCLFITSSDGYLRSFNLYEGFLLWEAYLAGDLSSSPAVSRDMVFVTGNDVYALDKFTGERIWRYSTSWPISSSPAVDNDILYVGSENDDRVYALNASTGRVIWSHGTGGWLSTPSIDSSKGVVLLGCRDRRIYCLEENSGASLWTFITDDSTHLSSPTITSNGLVFIGSLDNTIYCLNENTGQKIWSYKTGGAVTSSPTVTNDHLYIGSQDSYLYCFGPQFQIHDLAVTDAAASPTSCKPGEVVHINYSVSNKGNAPENVTVTLAYNNRRVWASPEYSDPTPFHTETVTIEPEADLTSKYTLNTSGLEPGRYDMMVQAALVPNEVEASNNAFFAGSLLLPMMTDLNADGRINIIDVASAAKAYGTHPGDEEWNPDADLDDSGVINIVDIARVAKDLGKIYC